MKILDTSSNPRIPLLTDFMRSINSFTNPNDLLDTLISTIRAAYGKRCYAQLTTRGLSDGSYRIHRLLTHDDLDLVDHRLPHDSPSRPLCSGGIFGHAIAGGRPIIFHDLDLSSDPCLGDKLAPYRSLIAVPLNDNHIGVDWVATLDPSPAAFDATELENFIFRANLISALLSNLHAHRQLHAAHERIAAEIEQIARIQRALLPDGIPEIPGVRLAASYNTFDRAGGDLYDFTPLCSRNIDRPCDDPRWAILIGDVSGHGPAAAVVMAMFHAILRSYPDNPAGPGEVLRHINRHLQMRNIDNSFVTAFLAFYHPQSRLLTYSRAGHNPPLLKDFPHQGAPLHLDAVGELPLGILPDVHYSETTIPLHPGQTLILYTDGITEARKPNGQMFGLEGIEHSLIHCTGEPPCAINHITQALMAHQVGVKPNDDQTVIAMQVL